MADNPPSLICVAGPRLGQTFPLIEGKFVFGRDASCDVSLLEGIDSRNGSFLNGGPVHEAALSPADGIRLSGSVFINERANANPASSGPISDRGIGHTASARWLSRAQRLQVAGAGRTAAVPATGYRNALNEKKKQLILEALALSGGRVATAAEKLDPHPNYLHRLMSNPELQ